MKQQHHRGRRHGWTRKHPRSTALAAFTAVVVLVAVAAMLTGVPSNLRSQTTAGIVTVEVRDAAQGDPVALGDGLHRVTDGDDYAQLRDTDGTIQLILCDAESDGNPVRVDAESAEQRPIRVSVEESRGAGYCTATRAAADISRLRVCERNTLWWSCDNWTSTT